MRDGYYIIDSDGHVHENLEQLKSHMDPQFRNYPTRGGGFVVGYNAQAMVAGYLSTSYQSEVALLLMLVVLIVQAARRPMLQEEPA